MKCPVTEQNIAEKPSPFPFVEAILEKQLLMCANHDKGCEWQNTLKEYFTHLNNDCQKQVIKCPFDDCAFETEREKMEEHKKNCDFRKVECSYCHDYFIFSALDFHLTECQKFILDCPLGCEEKIAREDVDRHIKDFCMNSIVKCPLYEFGCEKEIIRREVNDHVRESQSEHLILLANKFKSFFSEIEKRYEKINDDFTTFKQQVEDKLNLSQQRSLTRMKRSRPDSEPNEYDSFPLKKQKLNNDEPSLAALGFIPESTQIIQKRTENRENQKTATKEDMLLIKAEEMENEQNLYENLNGINSNNRDGASDIKSDMFDTENLPSGAMIKNNCISFKSGKKSEHTYVFTSMKLSSTKKTKWKCTLLHYSNWIALGLCDKKQVLSNKMKFYSSRKGFNHGSYLISTNNYIWNCKNPKENNICISLPHIEDGDVFYFEYDPIEKSLLISTTSFTKKLTGVEPISDEKLTPCMVFLYSGNEIQITEC